MERNSREGEVVRATNTDTDSNAMTIANSATSAGNNAVAAAASTNKHKKKVKMGLTMRACEVSTHILECPRRIVHCTYVCGVSTEYEKMKFHENGECATRVSSL